MEPETGLSFGDYLAAMKRRRMIAAYIAVPIVVIGGVLALALPDVYRSTAVFRLVTDRVVASSAEGGSTEEYVFGLLDKLFASERLKEILRDANPYPELQGDEGEALARLKGDVDLSMTRKEVLGAGGTRENMVNTGFRLSYENRSPEASGKVAVALAAAFVDLGRVDRLTVTNNKVKFFSGEADRLAEEIAQLERHLADFKAANFERLPESAQANFTMRGRLEQDLDNVDREISALQQNRVFVVQQLRQAQAGPAAGNLRQLEDEYARKSGVYADTHPDMVALRRQIDSLRRGGTVATGNSLQAQIDSQKAILAEARQRYSADHPDIRRMERNIQSLEARLAAGDAGRDSGASDTLMSVQLQTQLNAIDTQIGGLQARRASLASNLSEREAQLGAAPEVEAEYEAITRGLGSAREQFNQMISKRLEAEVDAAAISSGASDRFVLFSVSGVPRQPAGPPRMGILVVSLMLGVMLALSAVVGAEVLDSTVRGTRDIHSLMGSSPLAVVPEIRNSVFLQRRRRRLAVLAGSVAVGAPVLFLIVRVLSS